MLKKLAGQSTVYALSDFLVKSTNLILTPYFIFKLTLAEFGQFGIIIAILAFGQLFFNMGFQSAMVRYYYLEEQEREVNISSAFFYLSLFALPIIPLIAILIYLSNILDVNYIAHSDISVLITSSALYGIFINNTIGLLKVQEKPIWSGILGFSTTFTILISTIGFIELDLLNPLRAIIYGQIAGIVTGTLLSIIINRRFISRNISFNKFKNMASYSIPLLWHNMFQWVLNNGDRFIIIKILGPEKLGGYFFAYQFATITKIIFRSLTSSLLSVYSKYSVGKVSSKQITLINNIYIAVVFAVCILISIAGPGVVYYLNLEQYKSFVYLIPLLVAGAGFYGLYYIPMNIISITLGKTQQLYLLTMIAAVFSISANLIFVSKGVHIAGYVNLLSYLILLVAFVIKAMKYELFEYSISKKIYFITIISILVFSFFANYYLGL